MEDNTKTKENVEETVEDQTEISFEETEEAASQSKLFTQEEVNEIIRKRLSKVKKNEVSDSDLMTREKELTKRESYLNCKEYLIRSGYDMDMIEIIDTSDFEKFIKKADLMNKKLGEREKKAAVPLRNPDPLIKESKFSILDDKHVPRDYRY